MFKTMFNLSLPELVVIGAAGLLVFGPKRLPELAKSLGKGIRDFKKAMEGEDDPSPDSQTVTPLPPAIAPTPQMPVSAVAAEKVLETNSTLTGPPEQAL
jgi:sec-independent protein translocase protein TatA